MHSNSEISIKERLFNNMPESGNVCPVINALNFWIYFPMDQNLLNC